MICLIFFIGAIGDRINHVGGAVICFGQGRIFLNCSEAEVFPTTCLSFVLLSTASTFAQLITESLQFQRPDERHVEEAQ